MRVIPNNGAAIRALKIEGDRPRERFKIEGVPGLMLEISRTGKKTWHGYVNVQADAGRKQVWKRLGDANSMSLGSAIDATKRLSAGAKTGVVLTVDALFDHHVKDYRAVELHNWQNDVAHYNKHIKPVLGSVAVGEIDTPIVVKALDQIEARSTRAVRKKSQALLSSLFKWNRKRTGAPNHAQGLTVRTVPNSYRELRPDEIKIIWHGCSALPESQQIILKLLFLTGLRLSEIAEMERSEIDLAKGIFAMKPARRKRHRIMKPLKSSHALPLLPTAKGLIEQAMTIARPCDYVFPSRTASSNSPTDTNQLSKIYSALFRKLNVKNASAHSIRSTVKTLMVDAMVPREYADAVQDHAGLGNAGDIYDRSEYLQHKRVALSALEEAITRIVA